MLEGLRTVDGVGAALLFVKQFYGSPSRYIWEEEEEENRGILQGEGREQGDPLMLALFVLGLHQAFVAAGLLPSERLFAFLDDISVVCSTPSRTCRDGVMPHGTDALTAASRIEEDAIVWRGDPAFLPRAMVPMCRVSWPGCRPHIGGVLCCITRQLLFARAPRFGPTFRRTA